MKIIFSQKCLEYFQPGHPESPERVAGAFKYLNQRGFELIESQPCTEEDILLVHSKNLLEQIKNEDMFIYAKLSAGAAIQAALFSLKGEKIFSLMRPPGHHASKNQLSGFCYFNNIAIATMRALRIIKRTAIVDIDCHHGNGTEDIVLDNKNILYVSLHQSPLYPGTGLKSRLNCLNYPLPAGTKEENYLAVLDAALKKVEKFNPDLIGISAGFDAYKDDLLTNLCLEKETYKKIGERLSDLNKPIFAVLEGGYSLALPECIYQFLTGLEKG